MKNTIMVIGGYGQVGKHICKYLLSKNKQVIVAGRNVTKLNLFIMEATNTINQNKNANQNNDDKNKNQANQNIENKNTNQENQYNPTNQYSIEPSPAIAARVIDVANWQDSYLDGVGTVIMALEQNNMAVLEACTRCKVNYVDITPTGELIEAMEAKREQIKKSQIVACIGVGIAPGISNVMCENLARQFDKIEEINSYLMLGTGEKHGNNAVDWLVDNLGKSFYEDGDKTKRIKNFSKGRWTHLQGEKRKRRFVAIDLADWHIMKREHPEAQVRSWYAYDQNAVTILFEGLQKIGLFNLLKIPKLKQAFTKIMSLEMSLMEKIHFGTDKYAVMVEIRGVRNGKDTVKRETFKGKVNSKVTGKAAAYTAFIMQDKKPGLYYMSEL